MEPSQLARLSNALSFMLAIGTITMLWFFYKLYGARSHMRRLQRNGMPMPPHHWLFGHILVAARVFGGLPPYAHLLLIADQVRRVYPHLDTAFYLDTWPFAPPTLMVICPDMAAQFTQTYSLPKYHGVRQFLKPLTGKKDLVTMEGHEWKHWRVKFNVGFSAKNIANLVPAMIKDVHIYKSVLSKHAEAGDIFPLEHPTLAMSMDIIGRLVLNHELNSQTSHNPMTMALLDQVAWCNAGMHSNPLQYINVARPLVQKYNTWRMNSYLDPLLKQMYEQIRKGSKSSFIADLMMLSYSEDRSSTCRPSAMDPVFSEFLRAQVKLFLQAGHDTTAASIVYTLYMLQKHEDCKERLRKELDMVFGPDPSTTCDKIAKSSHLLNQCVFLLAVIKETLRLYPPTATARYGLPGFFVTSPDGKQLPTEKCLVVSNHHGLQRNPRFWPRAEEFLPERWLVNKNHPLYPVHNGWRPFERGLRNCLGQELAMTEIKVVVAVVVREFDVTDAYAEHDIRQGQAHKSLHVGGDRAYQITRGGCHPSEGFPCRIRVLKREI